MTLQVGHYYDVDTLRLLEWTGPDGWDKDTTGYLLECYFHEPSPDGLSRYIGPDVYGVEPVFDDV